MAQKKKKKNTHSQKKKSLTAKKTTRKKKSLFWPHFFKWALIIGIWLGLFLGGAILWFAKDLPDITRSATFERRASIVLKASDGSIIARYGEDKGQNIHVESLPPHLIHAVLATEDRRFYAHPGVDILGIARAFMINIYHRRFVQGGSTITQQLAKNLFLSHDRKLSRKAKEALLALWLERELSKNDILSAYMNRVYLGSGTYGFDAAARLYFGKPASDVNLHEAAILAGLLKAPSRYSPLRDLKLAKERAQIVLIAMRDAGYITRNEIIEAQNTPIILPAKDLQNDHTRYFADWVIDGLDDLIGSPNMDIIVETTLNINLQNSAHEVLKNKIKENEETYSVSQGAALSMRPDGAVISMIGGKSYSQSQFNRTTQARRSPGSSFKPFLYLAALEKGWKPYDKILDAPITEGEYRPKNFANKYYGTVTLEQALTKSMNTASVRLSKDIGIDAIIKTARELGILSPLQRDLSLSLGSSGTSMLEMTTAYATLANGGRRIFPYAITRITDKNGTPLYERKAPNSYQSVVKYKHTKALTEILQNVLQNGTGRAAKLPFKAAGKTGTSQDNRDAWFIGYSDRLITSVWLGNDDNTPMKNITGGGLPALIWKDIMLHGENNLHQTMMPSAQDNNSISGLLGRLLSAPTPIQNSENGNYSRLND